MQCSLASPSPSATEAPGTAQPHGAVALRFQRQLAALHGSPQAWDLCQEIMALSSSRAVRPGRARPAVDLRGLLYVHHAVDILLTAALDGEQATARQHQLQQLFSALTRVVVFQIY